MFLFLPLVGGREIGVDAQIMLFLFVCFLFDMSLVTVIVKGSQLGAFCP